MSTPTTRLRLELQALGSGLNTWGVQGLNGIFNVLDESLGGVKEITLTGNHTLTTTNYSSNESRFRNIKFIGSPGSAPTITIPATENWYLIENACGQTITISNSVATGTLANGLVGYVRTNGGSTLSVLPLLDQTNGKIVADNIASVNTVAGDINSVIAVSGKSTEVGRLGTTAAVADLAALGGTTEVASLNALSPRAADIGTLAPRASDLQALAPREADLNTLSPRASDLQTLAPRASDLQALAPREADLNTLSPRASDLQTLSPRAADIGTLADVEDGTTATNALSLLAPRSSDMQTLAPRASDMQTLSGISSAITGVNAIASDVTAVNTNPLKQSILDVDSNSTNINSVATNQAAISNVSSNISNVNNFNDLYQIASSPPSTDGGGNSLSPGDLYFDTAANELKVWNGSAFQGGVTATGNFVLKSNNLNDLASVATARTNLGLDPLLAAKAPLASPAFTGSVTIGGTTIKTVATSGAYSDLSGTPTHLNVTGGSAGTIPYQTGANTTGMSAVGTVGQVLSSNGTGAPTWINQSSGGGIATQMKFS